MSEGSSVTGAKLSEDQILECLKSLNVPVRMNDLKVPTREFIVRVFECMLRDLRIDIASPQLRSFDAIRHIEDGEIYEEAQLLTLLAKSVNYITEPCGLHITIRDIVEPKPKRTKKILNYILVFWNYYLQKYARFHAMVELYENEKKKAEEVIRENESLDAKHNDLLVALNNLQPSKEELSSIVKEKEGKISKLNAESESVAAEYNDIKKKASDIIDQIGSTDLQIITAKETLAELAQLILSSPERINSEIGKLQDKIKNEGVKIRELDNRYKDAVKALRLQEESEKEGEKLFSTLTEIKEHSNCLGDTVASIVDINQKISDKEDKLKQLEMDLARKEELKKQQTYKSAKVFLSNKKQVETLREVSKMNQIEKEKLQKKKDFLEMRIASLQEDICTVSDNIHGIIKSCKEADARSKERDSQFKSKMKSISCQFKSDCKEVIDEIHATFPNASSTTYPNNPESTSSSLFPNAPENS